MAKALGKQCVNKSQATTSHLKLFDQKGRFVATTQVKGQITDQNNSGISFNGIVTKVIDANNLVIRLTSLTPNPVTAVDITAAVAIVDGLLSITLTDTATSTDGPPVADVPVEFADDTTAP
jgi:hypothetical protein